MADTNAMADIRSLDVDRLVRGFADEALVLRNFLQMSKTSAREIRWYQKTAGFLDSADTSGITASQIYNTSSKSIPVSVEPSWTRQTSRVKKFMVESPWFSIEDIKDTDVDLLATTIRDLVRAVGYQVDARCYSVITEALAPNNIQTGAATADGWNDTATGDPILDLLAAQTALRNYSYDPMGAIVYINPAEHQHLLHYLISVKGSSIPQVAGEKLEKGVVMGLLGMKIVVSTNATTDYALVFVPQRAATWKSFMPLTSAQINDPGIGVKVRVWEEGECLLTDPKAVYLITSTIA